MKTLVLGLIAGAVGKIALDVSTYLDMLLRGRPASEVPARVAMRSTSAAAQAGEELVEGAAAGVAGALEPAADRLEEVADQHGAGEPGPRASASGALSGIVIGLGLGAAYALLRQRHASLPGWATILSGTALGAAAMAASDVPSVMTGATSHPREWTITAWLSDIVPHVLYGIVTAATFEALRPEPSPLEELATAVRG